MAEPSELNLWALQWRSELIGKARADLRKRDSAWQSLKDKSTDYAKSIKMARDVSAQVLAVWESSPVDLDAPAAPKDAQEPVAWRFRYIYDSTPGDWRQVGYEPQGDNTANFQKGPLYASPSHPQPDYKEAASKLWMLLDDIDTLDDACRADDAAFRKHARDVQRKRFAILSGEQMDVLLSASPQPQTGGAEGVKERVRAPDEPLPPEALVDALQDRAHEPGEVKPGTRSRARIDGVGGPDHG